jgi:hypothetical protein
MAETGDDVTSWHYKCGHRRGAVVTGADTMITPSRPCLADGRAELARVFDRLPGLTLAAVPLGPAGLLLGDSVGDTTLVDHDEREPATVAAFVWLATGRRLRALGWIIPERGLRTLQRGTAELVVALSGPGRAVQHFRLVNRRA